MKVTIETNEEKEQEITFPCLMHNSEENGLIIFAIGMSENPEGIKGVVVREDNWNKLGKYSSHWNERILKPLPKGTKVILEN